MPPWFLNVRSRSTGTLRIWDLDPSRLCRQHLLGEHAELHGLWNVLTQGKEGYRQHPETQRWIGKLAALYRRHDALAEEMTARGYTHASPLDPDLATGREEQDSYVDTPAEQVELLRRKGCACDV